MCNTPVLCITKVTNQYTLSLSKDPFFYDLKCVGYTVITLVYRYIIVRRVKKYEVGFWYGA